VNDSKPCARCGGEPRVSSQAYCAQCLRQYKRDRTLKIATKNPLKCVSCGGMFVRIRSRQTVCSEKCRATRAAPRPKQSQLCVWCDVSYLPKRMSSRFCSMRCYEKWRYATVRSQPDFLESRTDYLTSYAALNRDALRAKSKTWREANPDRHRETNRTWWHANKHNVKPSRNLPMNAAKQRKRQKRIRDQSPYYFSHYEVLARLEYWSFRCWMCQGPFEAVDHVKPLCAGGLNVPANMRPACRSCNSSKGGKWFGVQQLSLFLRG